MRRHYQVAALLLVPAVFLVTGLLKGDAPAVRKSAPAVISPPDHGVLSTGSFYVICKGDAGDLTVDGAARPWAAFAEPLHVAHLRLTPGTHELAIGERKLTVCIADEGKAGPAGRDAYYVHAILACGRCHETAQRDGRTEVKAQKAFSACLECHKSAEFEAKHSHPLEPLKHCAFCHAPHGSPRKGLLKAPVKKLCAECHES